MDIDKELQERYLNDADFHHYVHMILQTGLILAERVDDPWKYFNDAVEVAKYLHSAERRHRNS